jgi:hypothetical protein
MGKILNTTYHDTVESITNFYSDLVNNPFYVLNDKKPVICTYYNINKDYSSLDPGSKLQYSYMGSESPIRYNRIYDFLIYGFNRVELNTDNGEFGLEADKIEGDCYILPNTIIPTEGDYFEVEHIKDSTWLFMVKDVQQDTLDNGSNVYKLSYKLEFIDNKEILDHIVYNFRLIEERNGTNISKIVRCEDYDIARLMDIQAVKLKKYYEELFYNEKVQTFIYMDVTEFRVYDPYMIEFLIRNKVLDNGEDSYVYVCHQIPTKRTFSIDYDQTFFRALELNDIEKLSVSKRYTNIDDIKAFGTIFATRYETYFQADYVIKPGYNTACLDDDILENILDKKIIKYDQESDNNELWKNIIIKYFLKETYTDDEVNSIDNIRFKESKDAFYLIPLLIYCLEQTIEKVLK